MPPKDHHKVTGFSGNEIYCLHKMGLKAGQLCLGNNVLSLGIKRGIGAGLSNLAGGEITEITKMVHDGRMNAYKRMIDEARHHGGGIGIGGVSFDIINHGSNLEFLAFGSTIARAENPEATATPGPQQLSFSSYGDGQQLYCQIDAGFSPRRFVFGNIAYSIGVGGNIRGAFRGLKRGEVPQYTEIFDRTRHLALTRIKDEAKKAKANAVVGIQTSITPLLGAQEMLMMGTASHHAALDDYLKDPVTSDMTNEEMWNMAHMGYLPLSLVMGVSVYSLGLASGLASIGKSLLGGEVSTLTELLYEAREKAFERIERDADKCNADEVVGVKTYVYDLGGGLVEIMAIGTAVKKFANVTTKHEQLPPQAIIQDRDTFIEAQRKGDTTVAMGRSASAGQTQRGPIKFVVSAILIILYIALKIAVHE